MTQRIAIYGGTFDPIHYGHLWSIEELSQVLSITGVSMVPSFVPPHRAEPGASSEQRLAMLTLASQEFPALTVDDREIKRQGTSYTVDTLSEIRAEQGPEAVIFFVLGSDAFALLHTWRDWQVLTDLAHLIVMERPGLPAEPGDLGVIEWAGPKTVQMSELQGAFGQICRIQLTQHDISATEVRKRVKHGESIRELVPLSVAKYIDHHKLYN